MLRHSASLNLTSKPLCHKKNNNHVRSLDGHVIIDIVQLNVKLFESIMILFLHFQTVEISEKTVCCAFVVQLIFKMNLRKITMLNVTFIEASNVYSI